VYHGITSQRCDIHYLLDTLSYFLACNPGETLFLSLKDEVRDSQFSKLLYKETMDERYRDMWFLEDRIPTLGEVRGKAIVICRFPICKLPYDPDLQGSE
jgi:1-phosphatidylinositol phosphodiesterase